ncbi:KIF3A, partial [Symbiodinium sp. KB8]
IPRVLQKLFGYVDKLQREVDDNGETFSVSISFLQIYQERIYDLLNPAPVLPQGFGQAEDSGLRLRWDAAREHFYVENLFVYQCTSAEDALKFYNAGVQRKQMASTAMNIASSRSHTVLMLTLRRRSVLAETSDLGSGEAVREVMSHLALVDLAGSEKAAAANEGNPERFKEAVNINQSLFVLRRVITALSRRDSSHEEDTHIPYRESKLTSLLQHAIGGKGFMVMLACLSPADRSYEENLSTLQYAAQAALIKNEPTINLDPKDRLIQQLQQQLSEAHAFILEKMGLQELPPELRRNSLPAPRPRRAQARSMSAGPLSKAKEVTSGAPSSAPESRRRSERSLERGKAEDPPKVGSEGEKRHRLPPIPSQRSAGADLAMYRLSSPSQSRASRMKHSVSVESHDIVDSPVRSASAADNPRPQVRSRGLPRTCSWDPRKSKDLESQLKEAEAATQALEAKLRDALRRKAEKAEKAAQLLRPPEGAETTEDIRETSQKADEDRLHPERQLSDSDSMLPKYLPANPLGDEALAKWAQHVLHEKDKGHRKMSLPLSGDSSQVVTMYCWCYTYLWAKPLGTSKLDELLEMVEQLLELSFQSMELQGVVAENLTNPNATSRQKLAMLSVLARSSHFPPEFKEVCAEVCSKSSDAALSALSASDLVNTFNIHLCTVFDGPAALKHWMTEDAGMKSFFQVHTSQKWYQKQDQELAAFLQSPVCKTLRQAAEKEGLNLQNCEPGQVYHLEMVEADAKERLAALSETPPLAVICIKSKEQLRWYVPVTAQVEPNQDLAGQNRCHEFRFMFRGAVQKLRHVQTMGYRPCVIWLSEWNQLETEAARREYLRAAVSDYVAFTPSAVQVIKDFPSCM